MRKEPSDVRSSSICLTKDFDEKWEDDIFTVDIQLSELDCTRSGSDKHRGGEAL